MNKITIEDLPQEIRTEICSCKTSGFNKKIELVLMVYPQFNEGIEEGILYEVVDYDKCYPFTELRYAIDYYNKIERRTDVLDQR